MRIDAQVCDARRLPLAGEAGGHRKTLPLWQMAEILEGLPDWSPAESEDDEPGPAVSEMVTPRGVARDIAPEMATPRDKRCRMAGGEEPPIDHLNRLTCHRPDLFSSVHGVDLQKKYLKRLLGVAFDGWCTYFFFDKFFGACRRRSPRTRVHFKAPKDTTHPDPSDATL